MNFLDVNQKMLIEILSAVIMKRKANLSFSTKIDWHVVVKEADRHKIIPILHYFILKYPEIQIPDYIKDSVRKKCLVEITEQERNDLAFGEVLKKIVDSEISVVILKGLFIRDLYSEPWLRSMNDYDVLVRPEEIDNVTEIMKNEGYKKARKEDKDAEYSHSYLKPIEVHKSLISAGRFVNSTEFGKKLWANLIPVKVFGVDVFTLGFTDHITYLVLHVAAHFKNAGFGLRQLCDLVLFIQSYGREINWDVFARYIKAMDLEIFTRALFEACHKLFGLNVPEGWECDERMNDTIINFILDVFYGGAYGNENYDRITANRMIYYSEGSEVKTSGQKIRTLLALVFPRSDKLDVRFAYAKKYRMLLPLAWIHRFIYTIVRRDIDISEKIAIFRPKKSTEIYAERSLLLKQLGLIKNKSHE